MEELIALIQSGDLTNNQILTRVTVIHNQNCDEMNAAVDRIEELEAQATVNQLATLEMKEKLNTAVAKCAQQAKSIKIIEKSAHEAVEHAKTYQNRVVVLESQLKLAKADAVDYKRLKTRVKRLTAANQSHQKGRVVLKANMKTLKNELAIMCRENAKLRITGHKKVGKYNFTIFPVKVHTEAKERKVALAVYNDEGAMKIITRHEETGTIVQPKSHNFKFNNEESTWINEFFDVVDAHDNRFDDPVLRLVN